MSINSINMNTIDEYLTVVLNYFIKRGLVELSKYRILNESKVNLLDLDCKTLLDIEYQTIVGSYDKLLRNLVLRIGSVDKVSILIRQFHDFLTKILSSKSFPDITIYATPLLSLLIHVRDIGKMEIPSNYLIELMSLGFIKLLENFENRKEFIIITPSVYLIQKFSELLDIDFQFSIPYFNNPLLLKLGEISDELTFHSKEDLYKIISRQLLDLGYFGTENILLIQSQFNILSVVDVSLLKKYGITHVLPSKISPIDLLLILEDKLVCFKFLDKIRGLRQFIDCEKYFDYGFDNIYVVILEVFRKRSVNYHLKLLSRIMENIDLKIGYMVYDGNYLMIYKLSKENPLFSQSNVVRQRKVLLHSLLVYGRKI